VVRDDLVPADSTKGRLRVLNAAGAGALDVFLDGDTAPLFDHLEVRDDDGFKDLDTGSHSVVVRADGETVSLLRLRVEVKPGQSITLVLAPPAAGRKLASIIITDELTPAPAPRGD
jgi:hypothetical protein